MDKIHLIPDNLKELPLREKSNLSDSFSSYFIPKEAENMEELFQSASNCLKFNSDLIANQCSFSNPLKAPADFLIKSNLLKPDSIVPSLSDGHFENLIIVNTEPSSQDTCCFTNVLNDSKSNPVSLSDLLTPDSFLQSCKSDSVVNVAGQTVVRKLPFVPFHISSQPLEVKGIESPACQHMNHSHIASSTNYVQEINCKEHTVQDALSPSPLIPSSSVRRKLNFEVSSRPSVAIVSPLSSSKNEEPKLSISKNVRRVSLEEAAKLLPVHPSKQGIPSNTAMRGLPKDSVIQELPNNPTIQELPNVSANQELPNVSTIKPNLRKSPLPPIGVFWDIENCCVPKGLSATHIVQAIRNRFFDGYREAEFLCVCNTLKENPKILQELNDAQVNVLHVGSNVKNAADGKLLQSMRRFADSTGPGACVVLISGDADFATELYDLRYRKNLRVILVHNVMAQDSLKLSAHETALFSELTQELPQRTTQQKPTNLCRELTVWNLPRNRDVAAIRRRLIMLASSCGGKVTRVTRELAKITFQRPELAARAKKRIDDEDVFGSPVYCSFSRPGSLLGSFPSSNSIPASNAKPNDFLQEKICGSSRERVRLPWQPPPFNASSAFECYSSPAISSFNNSFVGSPANPSMDTATMWRPHSPSDHSFMSNGYSLSSGMHAGSQSSSRDASPQPLYLRRTPDYLGSANPKRFFNPMDSYNTAAVSSNNDSYFSAQLPPTQHRAWSPPANFWTNGEHPKRRWRQQSPVSNVHINNVVGHMNNLSLETDSQILEGENEVKVALVDRTYVTDLWNKTRTLLWDESSCSLEVKNFMQKYSTRYNEAPKLDILRKDLEDVVKIDEGDEDGMIKLIPTQIFARDLLIILHEAGGRMLLTNLETAYLDRFGITCRPAACGFPNLLALMQNLREFVTIKGRGAKRILVLNKEFADIVPKGNPYPNSPSYGKLREPDQFYSLPYNPVPVPVPPPPSINGGTSQMLPQSPDFKHKHLYNDPPNSHILMGLTPSPQPSRYQPPSPLIYPGSPVSTNGSVIWSQLWSPPYSVIPSMSPHYMVPTVPINWGSLGHAIPPSPTPLTPEKYTNCKAAPISIHTLDQFEKMAPPNPSELPNPELLTQNSFSSAGTKSSPSPSKGPTGIVDPADDVTGTPNSSAKKRLAAHFDTKEE